MYMEYKKKVFESDLKSVTNLPNRTCQIND